EFFGNPQALAELSGSIKRNQISPAWIFLGPEGIGKATLAYRFARYLMSDQQDRDNSHIETLSVSEKSPAFRQVAALSQPNLLVLRRPWNKQTKNFFTSIPVDEVRRLRSFVQTTRAGSSWRVVIIDRADDLNINSANALLKTLEEPPVNTVFLLITSVLGKLPVTIRSRCRVLKFVSMEPADLAEAVQNVLARTPDPDPSFLELWHSEIQTITSLAEGSVGRALQLTDKESFSIYLTIMQLLDSLPNVDKVELLKVCDQVVPANAGQKFEFFLNFLMEVIHRGIIFQAGKPLQVEREKNFASRFISPHTLELWAELWETMARMRSEVQDLNLDKKNLIIDVFHRIEELARRSIQ
ncbi:MAG: DNA polymerase III subunit delta', partial [Methyloligellaceae bacterium]